MKSVKLRTKRNDVSVMLVVKEGYEIVVEGGNVVELTEEQFKVVEGQVKLWSKYLEIVDEVVVEKKEEVKSSGGSGEVKKKRKVE